MLESKSKPSCFQALISDSDTSAFSRPDLKEVLVIKMIADSRFPVYLARSEEIETNYAMKVFYYDNQNDKSPYYFNEKRFSYLRHQNIIAVIDSLDQSEVLKNEKKQYISYILYEYAPYGHLQDLLSKSKLKLEEKLSRTYFHNLISGLEYLHSKQIGHLDLKPENLLIGEDFQLKICDFDSAYHADDVMILSKGTKNLRAKEIKENECVDYQAADIYSAGILLFTMFIGHLPYLEDKYIRNKDLYQDLQKDVGQFWEIHESLIKNKIDFSFKELFIGMTREDPTQRLNISQIKKNSWFQRETYKYYDLRNKVKGLIDPQV